MSDRTKVFHVDNKQDIIAIIKRELKFDRASQLMAFADHVSAASEPVPEDTMTAEDRKEQFGEECVYCGKDSWTCEHFKPEQESEEPYSSSRDEGRNPDGSGMSYGERNSG